MSENGAVYRNRRPAFLHFGTVVRAPLYELIAMPHLSDDHVTNRIIPWIVNSSTTYYPHLIPFPPQPNPPNVSHPPHRIAPHTQHAPPTPTPRLRRGCACGVRRGAAVYSRGRCLVEQRLRPSSTRRAWQAISVRRPHWLRLRNHLFER